MMSKRMKNMRVLLLMILAVFSLSVSAQTITATGNVKDATGDPIIGASIVEKGNTSNGFIHRYEDTRNCNQRKKQNRRNFV